MIKQLHFTDKKFKIMQIADVQENAKVNPDSIKLIDLALERENPDLVVFTGDQIMGYSPTFKKNPLASVNFALGSILEPIMRRNVPFCVTFGNHDRDCGVSHEQQMLLYQSYPSFVYAVPNGDDLGTFSVQIQDSNKTKNIFNLYVFDSNAKEEDGTYSPVFEHQIQWYKNEREKIKTENGAYLPSLVFQHIPVPEFFDVIKQVKKGTKGSVEAFYNHANEFYVLHDETIAAGGFMGESPAAPVINNGQFEALKEKGEVLGLFVGHDHNNSFVKNLDGIDLGYTQGAGFNTYGPGDKRGVRIFELDEEALTEYKTRTLTMGQLCDFKPSNPVKEIIMTKLPTSIAEGKKLALKVATGIAVVAVGGKIISEMMKK